MERGLQKIFVDGFDSYTKSRGVSDREYRAARHFSFCRTARLGGHKEMCPEGHFVRAHYHSCRHRSCPQCNALASARWLEAQKAKLLDCPHHHMVFTIPHELIPLWQFNRSNFTNILFRSVRDSLLELLSDPRYLGAAPGIQCAFHSWGRDLSLHPHIHCLITDGGLTETGEWKKPTRSHFMPTRVVMRVFRGIFSKGLHQALEQGQMQLPGNDHRYKWHGILKRTQSKKWNVNLQSRYDHGRGVASYLARYVRGGPIRNHQLRINDGRVTLSYYAHRDNPGGQRKVQSQRGYSLAQFIARFLEHVPESRRRVVRTYGLYAGGQGARLNAARLLHHQVPIKDVPVLDWQAFLTRVTGDDYRACPECGKALRSTPIPRSTGPPHNVPANQG